MAHELVLKSLKKNNPDVEFTGVEVETIYRYQDAYQTADGHWIIVDENGQSVVDDLEAYRSDFNLSFRMPKLNK